MITIVSDIPAYAFLSALSDLVFSTDKESAVVIFTVGGEDIFNERLYPDSSGTIRVRALDQLLEPYLTTNLIESFYYSINDGYSTKESQFKVQYCTVEVPYSASTFTDEYYLSPLLGEKITAMGRKEFLHLVSASSSKVYVECCYLMNVTTTVETNELKTITELNKVVTLDVSPSNFEKEHWKLLSYCVKTGNRKQMFVVDHRSTEAAPCLLFTNSFGCQETIYCTGTHQAAPDYTRNTALVDGKFKNYQIDENRVFKASTGILNTHMANWADDLFRSKEVYLLENSAPGKEITITDSKSERSNNPDALPNFSFEYRYAQRNHNILQFGAGRVFDNTFDQTFG